MCLTQCPFIPANNIREKKKKRKILLCHLPTGHFVCHLNGVGGPGYSKRQILF